MLLGFHLKVEGNYSSFLTTKDLTCFLQTLFKIEFRKTILHSGLYFPLTVVQTV